MSKVTRRGFLTKASMGAATVGVLAGVPGLGPVLEHADAQELELHGTAQPRTIVAFVAEGSRGEITLMAGTRKVVVRDRKLVARLMAAAR